MGVKFSQLPIASSVASDDYLAVLDTSERALKRTTINHASTTDAFGLGTDTTYGHNKIIDDLSKSTFADGEALSAHQGNVLANDLGYAEFNDTASRYHAIDEYFMFKGQFVKCTPSSILPGSTITVGTNVVATDVGSVLSQLNTNFSKINILIRNGNWRTGLRFKRLGSSFTPEQQSALARGDFSDFWNGDYWVINSIAWRIVDNTNFQRGRGNTDFNSNHLIVMPDSNLISSTTYLIDDEVQGTHGYANCAYRTRTDGKGREECKTLFSNAFGSSHIATHSEMMSAARGEGGATKREWQDADVELPSEVNLFGHSFGGCGSSRSAYSPAFNIGTQWGRFALFSLAPQYVLNGKSFWLRDVTSATTFSYMSNNGYAYDNIPSMTGIGLRPYAIIV